MAGHGCHQKAVMPHQADASLRFHPPNSLMGFMKDVLEKNHLCRSKQPRSGLSETCHPETANTGSQHGPPTLEPSSLVPSPLRGACPSPVPPAAPKANVESDQRQQPLIKCSLREEGFEAVDGHRDLLCRRAQQISVLVVLLPAQQKWDAVVPIRRTLTCSHRRTPEFMFLEAMTHMTGSAFDESMGLCPSLKFY